MEDKERNTSEIDEELSSQTKEYNGHRTVHN